jgi:TPP-dependent pyruvate/acetoin dehydrogenase alpha subunit
MRDELFQFLCDHCAEIAGQMDPENGFFRTLLSRGVLTQEQLEECRAEKTNARKVEAAILLLQKRPDRCFSTFFEVVGVFRPDLHLQVPGAPTGNAVGSVTNTQ